MTAPRARAAITYGKEPRRDEVELVIDRGLKSRKLDLIALTPDEAVELATDLLDAVRIIRRRADR